MPILPKIADFADELVAIRRDIHQHPELGFEEVRTSELVATKLAAWGIEVHRGIGKTGVVGVLKGAKGDGRMIGLRADMDALPIEEKTNLPYASKRPGLMHACGHDGHTTMLLGAARYLAETRDFAGTAVFIFQPAEEGLGGARAMLADGLLDRFPCDELYGVHNSILEGPYKIGVKRGAAMAGADFFDIRIRGRGSHAARPEDSIDPIVAAAAIVQALQTLVSRNVSPLRQAVLSITKINAGSAYNIIPEEATLAGTVRYLDGEVGDLIRARMTKVVAGTAAAFAVEAEIEFRNVFDVLVNTDSLVDDYLAAARDVVGEEGIFVRDEPMMGSEDFADMLKVRPGAYCTIGHAGSVPLHNAGFVLDEGILPVGASVLARIVERRLAP
jgi:hippurate hydrolase